MLIPHVDTGGVHVDIDQQAVLVCKVDQQGEGEQRALEHAGWTTGVALLVTVGNLWVIWARASQQKRLNLIVPSGLHWFVRRWEVEEGHKGIVYC